MYPWFRLGMSLVATYSIEKVLSQSPWYFMKYVTGASNLSKFKVWKE